MGSEVVAVAVAIGTAEAAVEEAVTMQVAAMKGW